MWPRRYDWERRYEAFAVCPRCSRSTVYILQQRTGSNAGYNIADLLKKSDFLKMPVTLDVPYEVMGYIAIKDMAGASPPDHVPEDIANAFREGATSVRTECWNAAGAMFRLTVDLATKKLVPEGQPKKLLAARLADLFDKSLLPDDLRELAKCIKDDGNDGAHDGTLKKPDALDLQDFAIAILERIYTQPERLKLAKERREERRKDV